MNNDMVAQSRDITDLPQFKTWFGGSQVVNDAGKPLTVFHGTAADFSQFDPARRGLATETSDSRLAFFFTSHAQRASAAAYDAAQGGGEGAAVMPVFLRLENPLIHIGELGDPADSARIIRKAKREGHDGVIFQRGEMGGQDYAVFDATSIKSATANEAFSRKTKDIRFSMRPAAARPRATLLANLAMKPVTLLDDKLEDWVIDLKRASLNAGVDVDISSISVIGSQDNRLVEWTRQTEGFQDWFRGSMTTTPSGAPLIVYRGEYGPVAGHPFDAVNRRVRATPTFTDDVSIANIYALDPNDRRAYPSHERVSPFYLAMRRPLVLSESDEPFTEIRHLLPLRDYLDEKGFAGMVEALIERGCEFRLNGDYFEGTIEELAATPDAYTDSYHVADNELVTKAARAAGFDGFEYWANTQTEVAREFRVFSRDQVVNAIGAGTLLQALPAQPAPESAEDMDMRAVEALAGFFGAEVVVFKGRCKPGAPAFNGAAYGGRIWLNADADKPLHRVFGHELAHAVHQTRPIYFKALATALAEHIQADSEELWEEALGEILADCFAEPQFWERVQDASDGKFKQLAEFVCRYADLAAHAIEDNVDPSIEASTFAQDIDAMRSILAEFIADYAEEIATYGPERKRIHGALAANIDDELGSIYQRATSLAPAYAGVFEWVGDSFNDESVSRELLGVALKRGLIDSVQFNRLVLDPEEKARLWVGAACPPRPEQAAAPGVP